ncbi:MAG: NADH:flavin oxidoreductase [Planctomycetota bacterium]|nr:NADH:flavin oxidoreductase [Planctomycetota bacterium]
MSEFPLVSAYKDVDAFRARLAELGLDCDRRIEDAGGPLGQPVVHRGRTIGNRWAAHPMEGWDGTPGGQPTELTLRRWRNFGRSGAKLIWGGEAYAVTEDGRANPHQLCLNPNSREDLTALLAAVRAGHREAGLTTDDLYCGLQLTHSGRWARPRGAPAPRIPQHHPLLDRRSGVLDTTSPLTDGELEGIARAFVDAALLAREVGFDFVDIKCCHGYLLHELLAARQRPGPYGGDLAGRTALFRRIVSGIRASVPDFDLGVRLSLYDCVPHAAQGGASHDAGGEARRGSSELTGEHLPYEYGFGINPHFPAEPDLQEPFQFLEMLRENDISLVNITLGSPYYCPHLQRPASWPPSDGYAPPEDPLASVAAHLRATRAAKAAFPDLLFVGTGYTYLQEYLPQVAQYEVRAGHTDFVGIGRLLLSYPELPQHTLAGRALENKRLCRTFSDCTSGPRSGEVSGCYPLDPHYRSMAAAAPLRAARSRSSPPNDSPHDK